MWMGMSTFWFASDCSHLKEDSGGLALSLGLLKVIWEEEKGAYYSVPAVLWAAMRTSCQSYSKRRFGQVPHTLQMEPQILGLGAGCHSH